MIVIIVQHLKLTSSLKGTVEYANLLSLQYNSISDLSQYNTCHFNAILRFLDMFVGESAATTSGFYNKSLNDSSYLINMIFSQNLVFYYLVLFFHPCKYKYIEIRFYKILFKFSLSVSMHIILQQFLYFYNDESLSKI